ncbi:MAG: RsmE family RNA methyltransferase [Candidatus Binatia bacterium]|nr:RsmE family RNA methyltransferase [Candidatus Binatia bacterium]
MSARLFAERDAEDRHAARLSPASTRHLRSLRLETGDMLEAVLGPGDLWRAMITSSEAGGAKLSLEEKLPAPPEDPIAPIWLLVAIADLGRSETLVEKVTELGATDILFFRAARSQAREISDSRLQRLRRIALAACEQCRRTWPPRLAQANSLEAALQSLPDDVQAIAFDPTADENLAPRSESIAFLIGPEGGFDAAELSWLEQQNIPRCSLGPRTLRFETAAIAALAALRK